jgi:capsular polysaccharide biosynthesis protein
VELSGYFAVARRWWWTLIVAAGIAGLTGYLVASTIPPTYESQVRILVGPLNTDTDTLRGSSSLVQTYAQYVTTREVLASTIQELGLDLTPDEFAAATRATANDVTRILTIRVSASDPDQAADLANTLATELEQATSRGLSLPEGLVQIIEFATADTTPVAPQVSLLVILAALAGVVVAIVLVLLLEYFGNTVRTRQELASLAKAPLLGAVPAPSGDPPHAADLVLLDAPASRSAAPYRLISAKIALGGGEQASTRSILVTDADSESEAAIVGANLAAALSRFGRHVVLIDGSGQAGTITRLHGWQDRPGLSEMLSDGLAPVRPDDSTRALSILPAGGAPLEGADPDRLREIIIAALAGEDGLVVIVGAPIQASPVTLALAQAADSVILVARRDRTRREDVVFASESLRLVGATLAGVILTERGSIRGIRRDARAGAPRVAMPVEVRPPTPASPPTSSGDKAERRPRTRRATSGATRSIAAPKRDVGADLPTP